MQHQANENRDRRLENVERTVYQRVALPHSPQSLVLCGLFYGRLL
ncbi:MAG: hypothetical protein ACOVSW_09680 [Candidatus Kapaibacteriota bacterium]